MRFAFLLLSLCPLCLCGEPSDAVRLTTDGGFKEHRSWSPDGKRIAGFSTRDGNQDIYTTDLEGKDVKRLTNDPAPDNNPSWSPDGKRIAFCSGRAGHLQIYLMDADGSNVRRLTDHDGIDYW